MLLSLFPVELTDALAQEGELEVNKIILGKDFGSDLKTVEGMHITITGKNLGGVEVSLLYGTGEPITIKNASNSSNIFHYKFDKEQISKLVNITQIFIGDKGYELDGDIGKIPEISSISKKVNKDKDELIINGSNFTLLSDDKSSIKYGKGVSLHKIYLEETLTDNQIIMPFKDGTKYELGMQDIFIERETEIEADDKSKASFEINYSYNNAFKIVENLELPELTMFPNRGPKGSKVYFKAKKNDEFKKNPFENVDVYFMEKIDGTEPFSEKNKAKIIGTPAEVEDEYVLTVEIPDNVDFKAGEKYIVFTNKVDSGNFEEDIIRERVLKEKLQDKESEEDKRYMKFVVVDGSTSPYIESVSPNIGSIKGGKTKITAGYVTGVNIDGVKLNEVKPKIESDSTDKNRGIVLKELYEMEDNKVIGTYYGEEITSIERYIKVIIGKQAEILIEGSKFASVTNGTIDELVVKIPHINLNQGESPVKDVVIEIETMMKTKNNAYTFTERAEKPKGYTFIPDTMQPEITSVLPDEIFVEEEGNYFKIPYKTMIAIEGKNFLVTKKDGKTKYPTIRLNSDSGKREFEEDKKENIEIYVQDKDGQILDGTYGNEIGERVVIVLPKGTIFHNGFINEDHNNIELYVKNPRRGSDEPGIESEPFQITMSKYDESKAPTITDVKPDIVPVEGGDTVTITGTNFQNDVKVYLDGNEIKNFNKTGEGTKITFTAPKGREGVTQLQVLNPNGGMAVWDFEYVKTYTDPKIISFAPNRGRTGTMVVLEGENFLAPDPTATENDINRLIGTRVLLGGQDINDYNRDLQSKKIKFEKYTPAKGSEILKINEDGMQKYIEIADYWHSVILKDGEGKFYTLRPDSKGLPVLTDGVEWTYDLRIKNGKIYASPRDKSGEYEVEVCPGKEVEKSADENQNGENAGSEDSDGNEKDNCRDVALKLLKDDRTAHLTLTMLTPYKVEGTEIVGSRVKVLDSNTIYFWVPILNEGNGWYDVTVLNPDTKKDSRTGKQGFYYYTQPQSKPHIKEVTPNKGSTDGGYTVDIIGEDFKDDGFEKSRVYIGGVEVKPDDVKVSVNENSITVKIPPYDVELLKDKKTDRITVPVVVVNPDGGTANKEDGFTYMVPTSHPKINRIVPGKGSAAGKEVVEIFGRDFRYFEPYNDDNRNGKRDENEPFRDLNGNGKWDDYSKEPMESLKQNGKFKDDVIKVLPKVYFGDKTAEIIEFSDGYLKVITPVYDAKSVDVYVVNNDAGVSNKVSYTYEATNPFISKIVPTEGRKQGKDKIEIFGGGFVESDIKVVESGNKTKDKPQVLIRFGNISNHDIPRDEPNSGRIDNKKTTVELSGGLKVNYDGVGDVNKVHVQISQEGKTYEGSFLLSDQDGPVYFTTELLKDGKTFHPYNELIRFEIKDRRLLVERGYAPQVEFLNDGQLVVTTPSYYTIGEVDVTVINPDGGTATGKYTYKNPDSKPQIIDVQKEGESAKKETINGKDVRVIKVTYKGGHTISVIGNDFRENAKISIGNVAEINPNQITYMLPSKLTFKMPQVPEDAVGKLHRVVVTNEDGGIAASDDPHLEPPIYIMFIKGETGPVIEKLTPDKGPSIGGNKLKIEGKDFREGLKLYWGESLLPEDSFKVVDYKTIILEKVPPHAPGRVEVKVENPDGELSNSVYYTYLSSPKISAVVDPEDATESALITQISAEGGEVIKVKGYGFLSGARVLFNPTIKRVDEDITQGTIIYIDGKPYLLESGVAGTNVEVIDSETIKVTTPPGKVGTGGIIVINPDTGASDIYEDIKYVLPELSAPRKVVAELVYNRYIKVHWSPVEKAEGYDVYVVIDDNEIEFVGSTDLTSFVFSDLESDTRYKFIVKALGRFGSSQPSAESNSVRTKRRVGPPDDDGAIDDKTTERIEGDKALISIGNDDYKDDLTVDLAELRMHGAKKVVISIPARVVTKKNAGEITVRGKDFTLKFDPSVFETDKIRDYRNRSDAGVRFEISPYTGSTNLMGKKSLSNQYHLKADFFLGKDFTPIENLVSAMSLVMEYDRRIANIRGLRNIYLARYDGYRDRWERIPQSDLGTSIKAYIDKMGRFIVIGGRR